MDIYLRIADTFMITQHIDPLKRGWGWGYNKYGYIGDNSTTNRSTPVTICGNHTFNFIDKYYNSGNLDNTYGLDKNGKEWSWGYGNFGALGDNSTTNRSTPVAVYGNHTFTVISRSSSIDNHGKAWSWHYMCGDSTNLNRITPVAVCGNHTFCKIKKITTANVLCVDNHDKTWSWGANTYGSCGDNSTTARTIPVDVCGNHTFCYIYTAGNLAIVSYALDIHGKAWVWGRNNVGYLGTNNTIDYSTPVAIYGNHTFCKISYCSAIDNHGKAWGWGPGSYGRLGDNSTTSKSTPVAVCGNHTFCDINSHFYFKLAIDNHGKTWGWGYGGTGDIGNNSTTACVLTPVAVYGNHTFGYILNWVQVDDMYIKSPYLSIRQLTDVSNKTWGWGYNQGGQIGDNSTTSRSTPVGVCGNHTFCKVIKDLDHSLAIDNNKKSWSWGANNKGQLGDNTTTNRSTPVAICGAHTFCHADVGFIRWHVVVVDNKGKGWAFGDNVSGELGDNTTVTKNTPVAIYGTKTFCKVATGTQFSYGIDKRGKLWSWGGGSYGQIGNNGVTGRSTPTAVCGGHTFCEISGGARIGIGIDNHGKAWGWGWNYFGDLGTNNVVSYSTPVAIYGNHTFCKLANLGWYFSLAIDNHGKAWGWGSAYNGELGNNSNSNKSTPVAVCGNHTFCYINTMYQMAYAFDNHGKAWSWGSGNFGALGNNSTTNKSTPVAVCGNHTFGYIVNWARVIDASIKTTSVWS